MLKLFGTSPTFGGSLEFGEITKGLVLLSFAPTYKDERASNELQYRTLSYHRTNVVSR